MVGVAKANAEATTTSATATVFIPVLHSMVGVRCLRRQCSPGPRPDVLPSRALHGCYDEPLPGVAPVVGGSLNWESAALTRPRSQVRSLLRPPPCCVEGPSR